MNKYAILNDKKEFKNTELGHMLDPRYPVIVTLLYDSLKEASKHCSYGDRVVEVRMEIYHTFEEGCK